MPICAFLDASVLYPASLRNLLMRLTLNGLFQARRSADVHGEWIRAVLRNRPDLTIERLLPIRDAMDSHAEESVVTGYQSLIEELALPDPDDRHVLAAAIVGQANVIVTRNLKDFPLDMLARYGVVARHPDEFLLPLLKATPVPFIDAIHDQQASLTKPPIALSELLELFERVGLVGTVRELRLIML
jgi:predicted nucleic acid-binding protein